MTSDLSQLDVFYGDLTVTRAHVYARLPRRSDGDAGSISGEIRGPICLTAETLPVSTPLVDLGPGPTMLAQALVPDPCFWSPDLPAIYEVTVHLHSGAQIVATARRQIGLRWLGARSRNFVREAKRWILRGVSTMSTTATAPRQWHEANAAYVTDQQDPDSLVECTQYGALATVEVAGTNEQIVSQLRQLSQRPAAALAIVRGEPSNACQPREVAPNIVCAQPLRSGGDLTIRSWAAAIWAEGDNPRWFGEVAARTDLPVVAVRRLIKPLPLDAARAACDALQRDLAPIGQFAGYVV